MSEDELKQRLISFIREKFLGGDPKNELEGTTPLLEWGVLDSLNTAVLVNHINAEIGVEVPAARISARHFKNVDLITAMIMELRDERTALEAAGEH